MHCITLTKSKEFSPKIQMDNMKIYPSIKPHKGNICFSQKIFLDDKKWFMFYIGHNNDYYYVASVDVPINKYDLNQSFILLSHLFYLVMEINYQMQKGTKEHFFVNQLLFGIKDYLLNQSENVYLYATIDPIVERLFMEFDMKINVNPFYISQMKTKLSIVRYNQIQLKKECKRELNNFLNDFVKLSECISSKLNQQKKQLPCDCNCNNVGSDILEMVNKGTQNDRIVMEIGVQVDTYTNQVNQLRKNCLELKKELDKYRKEKDDVIILTMTEYAKMVKNNKELIKKAKQEGYEEYRDSYTQLDYLQLSNILGSQNTIVMIEVMQVWMINWVVKAYYLSMTGFSREELEYEKRMTLCFVEFWRNVVLVNIGRLKHPIFKLMLKEWIDLVRMLQKIKGEVNEETLDICFSHFATNYMGDCYYEKSMVPVFFNLLFSECRNIPILMGIINFYQTNRKCLSKDNKEKLLRDFEIVFTVDKAEKILRDNRQNVKIGDEASRVFFELC